MWSVDEWTTRLVVKGKPLNPLRINAVMARREVDNTCRAFRSARRKLRKLRAESGLCEEYLKYV